MAWPGLISTEKHRQGLGRPLPVLHYDAQLCRTEYAKFTQISGKKYPLVDLISATLWGTTAGTSVRQHLMEILIEQALVGLVKPANLCPAT